MSDAGYGFGDLPLEPIDAGTTVLIAGPTFSRAEDLARSMVVGGTETGEGALLISTNMACDKLLSACRATNPRIDAGRIGTIDCTGQDIGRTDHDVRVKYVSTQSDLTGIGMKFSALYESLYADSEGGRVRTGLVSLSSLSMYVELRTLFQFAQTLAGRIASADGLGVFSIDPTTHDARTVNTLGQVADARIEVRETEDDPDADGELRIRGLRDQPDGWQPFSLS